MARYKPEIGDSSDTTIKKVVNIVAETGAPVVFNHAMTGNDFIVQPGDTYGDALQKWRQAWGPEMAAKMEAEELVMLQTIATCAVHNIDELYRPEKGKSKDLQVIDWLISIVDAASDPRVELDRDEIVVTLNRLGYVAGVGRDEVTFARYIIGQAMRDNRCIINLKQVEEWRKRFGRAHGDKNQ